MPGHMHIVSFPTDDGKLHQVYADVHEDTSFKLSLDYNRPHLYSLLRSLRHRPEEVNRRRGKPRYDVTIGIYNHPALDGDSMALALVITEHIASFFGASQTHEDRSLALDGIPQIIATGDVDQNGIVQKVRGMDAKLTGILGAIESGSLKPGGVFVYPEVVKSSNLTALIRELEAKGWKSLAVSHIDDVAPLWLPEPVKPKPKRGGWAHLRRPLKWGAGVAIVMAVFAILISVERPSEQLESTKQAQIEKQCVGLSGKDFLSCIVTHKFWQNN